MATKNVDEKNWIIEDLVNDQSGSKTHEKIFKGQERLKEYDDIIEKMKTGADASDFIEQLAAAKLTDVGTFTQSYTQDLGTVIGKIFESTETMGAEFDNFRKFNTIEQGLIDKGADDVKNAETRLAEVKSWSNFRNIFFGWKDRAMAKATKDLEAAKIAQPELLAKAKMLFNERLRGAGIEELLDSFRGMTDAGVKMLTNMAKLTAEEYEMLNERHKIGTAIVAKTATEKTKVYAEVQQLLEELNTEKGALVNFTNGTREYADQNAKIDLAQQAYDLKKNTFDKLLAAHNSKEKFLVIIQANMTADKVLESNLASLAVKLKSDNEERESTYRNTVHVLKAANMQQTASSIEQVGTKTDQINLEEVLKIAQSSTKDALERLERHPEDMKKVLQVYGAYIEMTTKNKQRLDEFMKGIEKGYLSSETVKSGLTSTVTAGNGQSTEEMVENLIK